MKHNCLAERIQFFSFSKSICQNRLIVLLSLSMLFSLTLEFQLPAQTQPKESDLPSSSFIRRLRIQSLYLGGGPTFGLGSSEVFDAYTKYLGGRQSGFSIPWNISLGSKTLIVEGFRYGLDLSYYSGTKNENFLVETSTTAGPTFDRVSDIMTFANLPITLGIEFIPYEGFLRNYVGVGAGVVISSFEWNETVQHVNGPASPRQKTSFFNGGIVSPLCRLYTGAEFIFSSNKRGSLAGAFFVEVRYNYAPSKKELLTKAQAVVVNPPKSWDLPVNVGASNFQLLVGFSLQLPK